MFGLPTAAEQIPAGIIPRSPQKIRPTGIGRGTNLPPMIFLPCFSLSMITQEVRESTTSVMEIRDAQHETNYQLASLAQRVGALEHASSSAEPPSLRYHRRRRRDSSPQE